ncbi:alpha-1-antitrypsin-like [Dipodomys spectabilis]|uniref:alpha-1-antitrypsin-like n=1 Tax=Dipodomys spectabilis TaxID=105255 RepID=UPI001C54937A|nr:alpha-1-antitrypsin-like [Dipodomys spectabilis]
MPSSFSWGFLLLASLCCLFPGCLTEDVQETAASQQDQEHPAFHRIALKLDMFAFCLYWNLFEQPNITDFFFSPVNIAAALAMLSLGTKDATHSEILRGLGFNITEMPEADVHAGFQSLLHTLNRPSNQLELTTGSSLFINESLKLLEPFSMDVKNLYQSEAFTIDFTDPEEAKKQINQYMEKGTQGKIVDLVKDLDKDTVLALANYILFKGKWEKFNATDVRVKANPQVKLKTQFLYGVMQMHYCNTLSTWVMLTDSLGDTATVIIMMTGNNVQRLMAMLLVDSIDKCLKSTNGRIEQMRLPKLSISGTYDLEPVLSALGISTVFSNGADLSKVTKDAPLKPSKAVHKAVLTLDEKGIEAAAATFSEAIPSSLPPEVNNSLPFLITIYDKKTKIPLFLGKFSYPPLL